MVGQLPTATMFGMARHGGGQHASRLSACATPASLLAASPWLDQGNSLARRGLNWPTLG
jgi:hypothetical protein